ncbi:MAG: metallophosphoesterase [Clostridia bacterium]|nr:metallophosphoesterase [Clostridia bacterium]
MHTDYEALGKYLDHLLRHPASPEEVADREPTFYEWNAALPYSSAKYARELPKEPGRDFTVLNFADVQCHDGEMMSFVGDFALETMQKLIDETKPDLITLTGDNAFDPLALLRLIDFLESFNIPWAPVMGNADHDGLVSEFWADYRLAHAKNCLFTYGPAGMGDGNYLVNVTENGQIIHTLFFMDTHHEETMRQGSYDHLCDSQIAWFRWAAAGVSAEAGRPVPNSVFFHIPVPEVRDAWNAAHGADGELLPAYRDEPFCKLHEKDGAPLFNNGFFNCARECGTANILFGHDHVNCFSLPYRGVTLTYAMKTGNGCYWERETNGGTVLKIRSDGSTAVEQHYIDPRQTQVKRFLLEYYGVNQYEPNFED